MTPRHSSQACLWVRVRVRVRVKFRVGVAVAEAGNNLIVGKKNAHSLVRKPYLIETTLFYAGTSEEVRLRGQINASCEAGVPTPWEQ